MKKLTFTTLTVLIILAMTAGVALGLASGAPQEDTFVRATQPDLSFDTQDLSVVGSTTNCNITDTPFLKWDLSSIPAGQTIGSATLTLTTNAVSNTGAAQITLYKAGDVYSAGPNAGSPWVEEALTSNNAPVIAVPGDALETKAAPTAAGQTLVFDSTALVSYLNTELSGDKVASFALRFSNGCVSGVTLARFEDKESASGGPDLQLTNPTAVGLVKLAAGSYPSSSWVLLTVSAAILVLAAGFIFMRRARNH
jgi:hypothetical protein